VASFISYNYDYFTPAHSEPGDAAVVNSEDAEGEVVRYSVMQPLTS
jgi:hypothetical protein